MKPKICSLLTVGVCLLGLLAQPACTTTGQPDVGRIARVAKQAATIGTTEVLTAHPEWLPQFQLAEKELRQLAASPTLSLDDLLAIIQRLPVKELKSQEARLSFEGATLLISAIDVPDLPADRLAQLQPIVLAISDGLAGGRLAVFPPPAPAPTN